MIKILCFNCSPYISTDKISRNLAIDIPVPVNQKSSQSVVVIYSFAGKTCWTGWCWGLRTRMMFPRTLLLILILWTTTLVGLTTQWMISIWIACPPLASTAGHRTTSGQTEIQRDHLVIGLIPMTRSQSNINLDVTVSQIESSHVVGGISGKHPVCLEFGRLVKI